MANAAERRCKAKNRRGERCAANVVNAAGYCVAHDPERPADMRELGRRSAKARSLPKPERVHESLREYLRREVPPERVWQALEVALVGGRLDAQESAPAVGGVVAGAAVVPVTSAPVIGLSGNRAEWTLDAGSGRGSQANCGNSDEKDADRTSSAIT